MGLLNDRRRVMGAHEELPYDSEIEYLEVNADGGHAYINTEYVPKGYDIDINFEFMHLGYSNPALGNSTWIFACGDTAAYRQNGYVIYNRDTSTYQLRGTIDASYTSSYAIISYSSNVKYNIIMSKAGTITLNNTVYQINSFAAKASENTGPMRLFASSQTNFTYGRLYSFKLNKSDVPILDLIPVRIGDEGFMYDKVSGKLFGNAGTGRFILGKDV